MAGSLTTRFFNRVASSLRAKMLALALMPLLLLLPLMIFVLVWWGGAAFDRVLRNKVQADLAVADGYFERVRQSIGQQVESIGRSHAFVQSLSGVHGDFLQVQLNQQQGKVRLDFLNLLDLEGRIIASSGRLAKGQSLAHWPVVTDAREGRSSTAADVFPADLLQQIEPHLAERARTPILPTKNALPTERPQEDRGLIIHSAAPVNDVQGRQVGVLEGGVLLNHNLDFIDRINALVYPAGSLIADSRGTATLFLDDVRIATNVRLEGDARAMGTRLSEVVRAATLDRGETWLDRAFVVSEWFVSGYQPIIDSLGNRAGLLYIGFLEAPYQKLKRDSLIGVATLFGLAILLASILSLRGAASIFRPVERIKKTMQAIEGGQLDARVGPLGRLDEIGRLASHFDQLLDELEQRNKAVTEWGQQLDAKVAARTHELADSNRSLEAANRSLIMAQRQLVMSAKLAAIGELIAGMAHEINNPMAVMQGNLDLIRELLGPPADHVKAEFDLLDTQIERVHQIVSRLLQFARPDDYRGELTPIEIDPLFNDSLVLVSHLLKRGNIAIERDVLTQRKVVSHRNEVQQVLINLLVNAIQAMPDGGILTLQAEDWDIADYPAGLRITVRDTGIGIAEEQQARIFDPFYTTKRGIGTGLGLAISASLMHRYGGKITVDSTPGAGARFTMWLPLEPLEPHDMHQSATWDAAMEG